MRHLNGSRVPPQNHYLHILDHRGIRILPVFHCSRTSPKTQLIQLTLDILKTGSGCLKLTTLLVKVSLKF